MSLSKKSFLEMDGICVNLPVLNIIIPHCLGRVSVCLYASTTEVSHGNVL